ncbi:MAG: spermidine synthase [Gammaproteobacteria bacterium]|nr:spermidine synthase [Gammaproteobacteria bacterium]
MLEELDYQQTPLGAISLRRRIEPRLNDRIVYEVIMNGEYLMSSLFYEAEVQLSYLGLASLRGEKLNVVVGGLGLGYTAAAALEDDRVETLKVIDVMEPVISWHLKGMVPMAKALTLDERCSLVHDDFFAWAMNDEIEQDSLDAILLDIDHSPEHWLNEANEGFYSRKGLAAIKAKLKPGGVFGLWSDDEPDETFTRLLASVFDEVEGSIISFENPYQETLSTNGVYVAKKRS